ncbi:hypothetical protein GGR56DRAFT_644531 [Xylariaceae sp. FL0804]|nr:hypothetical protein GGR56DRAFT_644531 [Xylariaceae sp. FL0804]
MVNMRSAANSSQHRKIHPNSVSDHQYIPSADDLATHLDLTRNSLVFSAAPLTMRARIRTDGPRVVDESNGTTTARNSSNSRSDETTSTTTTSPSAVTSTVAGTSTGAAMKSTTDLASPSRRSFDVNKDLFCRMVQITPQTLTKQHLKDMGVTLTSLDLNTGKPGDGGPTFIRPFPASRILQVIQQTKPWTVYSMAHEKTDLRLYTAVEVLDTLSGYLHHVAPGEPRLIKATGWKQRGTESGYEWLNRGDRCHGIDPANWRVPWLLDKMDGKTPHISCLLANAEPLNQDRLSNAELWCILNLSVARLRRRAYWNQKFIPVTVISSSDRDVRIVQGYVDGEASRVHVRKSNILVLEGDDVPKLAVILSWCMGTPVGGAVWD